MHPDMKRGDAFLHNSPYHGNSHAADHCLFVPVIDKDGVHRYSVLAKAHQADCGNSKPTTYIGDATDLYEEGALIFPAVQVQRDYKDIGDIIRMCRARIRVPEIWWGDYLATLGAVRIGEHELLALGQDVGWDRLERHVENWFDYSERRITAAIRRLPSGSSTTVSTHDPFPGAPDGIPVKARVVVDAEAGRISIDLRDNPDCLFWGCSTPLAITRSPRISDRSVVWRSCCAKTARSAFPSIPTAARSPRPTWPTVWLAPRKAPSPRSRPASAWLRLVRYIPRPAA